MAPYRTSPELTEGNVARAAKGSLKKAKRKMIPDLSVYFVKRRTTPYLNSVTNEKALKPAGTHLKPAGTHLKPAGTHLKPAGTHLKPVL